MPRWGDFKGCPQALRARVWLFRKGSLLRSGANVVVVGEILGQCQINERLRSKWIIGITQHG